MVDINTIIGFSLAILAFCGLLFIIIVFPVALQLIKTLTSAQVLMDTVNEDLEPTIKEIRSGVESVKSAVKTCSSGAKSAFDNAGVTIVSSSKSVLEGIKSYISAFKGSGNGKSYDD